MVCAPGSDKPKCLTLMAQARSGATVLFASGFSDGDATGCPVMRGGKGNDPIESIVRDILVPVQGDYALCVEIANWDFLHVGRIKNRAHQRDAHASSHQCESTIVLIRLIDYPTAYSAFRQKLRGAAESFTM